MQSTLIRDNNSIISDLRRLLNAELQISQSGIIPEFQNSRFARVNYSRIPEFQIALWNYSRIPDLRGLTIPEFQIAQPGIIPDFNIWNSGVLEELGLANLEFWNDSRFQNLEFWNSGRVRPLEFWNSRIIPDSKSGILEFWKS